MELSYLYKQVYDCISRLAEDFKSEIKKDEDSDYYECDFQFGLFFLLSNLKISDVELFWDKRAVVPEWNPEDAEEKKKNRLDKLKVDLCVLDPETSEPRIAIEIKYGGWRAKSKMPESMTFFKKFVEDNTQIKLPKNNRIGSIAYDFLKLLCLTHRTSIKPIFLYFGRGNKSDLKRAIGAIKNGHSFAAFFKCEVDVILVHTASDRILCNADILKQ